MPLHSKRVAKIDLEKVLLRMTPEAAARLRDLLRIVATPGSKDPPPASHVTAADAAKLVADGNAAKVADFSDTTGWCTPFTVIEEKPAGARRRLILWPREQNVAAYAAGFQPDVDLDHVSEYLDAVRFEYGGTRDLEVGFWQVPITTTARRALRFRDMDGNVYEPTRLPMGHCAAVDVMQLITRVIANDPIVCTPQFAMLFGNPHVWVDGIRFAGTKKHVLRHLEAADRTAQEVGATWKEVTEPEQRYDFIGVAWDHRLHTVITADKTLGKIAVSDKTTAQDLEQLVGRLIFAAGVSRAPLAQFYFALKWARRISNKLNRGLFTPEAAITLPPAVALQLKQWTAAIRRPLTITQRTASKSPVTLFTDASDAGWGAVLVNDETAEFASAGAMWSKEDAATDISVRELRAVALAIDVFRAKLSTASRLHLKIDNTSVLSAVRRGVPRADGLAHLTATTAKQLAAMDLPISASYVSSGRNAADEPSRGAPVDPAKATAATEPGEALRYTRRGD